MADIFLSYASSDRKPASELAAKLKEEGLTVWWDAQLRPGEEWRGSIRRAIAEAKVVVVLWSQAAGQSEWVKDEASAAVAHGNAAFCIVDKAAEMPPIWRSARTSDISDWCQDPTHEESVDRFVSELRSALGHRSDKLTMANRKSLLLESRHRCSVCGVPINQETLQVAHIEPTWLGSTDNLLVVCSNCHARIDKETWKAEILREYKASPWGRRRSADTATTQAPETSIELTIDGDFEAFDEKELKQILESVRQILDLGGEVRIRRKREG